MLMDLATYCPLRGPASHRSRCVTAPHPDVNRVASLRPRTNPGTEILTGISISCEACNGPGFYIGRKHILIGKDAVTGTHCSISCGESGCGTQRGGTATRRPRAYHGRGPAVKNLFLRTRAPLPTT